MAETLTKKQMLDNILAQMQNVGQIDACAVVSSEGLLIADHCPPQVNSRIFAALCASVMGAAQTALTQMKRGDVNQIIVDGKEGQMLLMPAGTKAVLVALANQNTNLGLMTVEMERLSKEVVKVLETV